MTTTAIDTRLSVSQAARCAGVSEGSIRAWIRAGVLPAERTGLGALISPAALGAVITARELSRRERGGKGRAEA